MPRSKKTDFEKDEIEILNTMYAHAKDSIEELAKRSGFSRQKVWRIITKLEKEKVIWGYSTVIDDAYTKRHHFTLILKRTEKPIDQQTVKTLLEQPLESLFPEKVVVESIEYTHGMYDGVITFYTDTLHTALEFLDKMKEYYSGYFEQIILLEPLITFRRCGIANPHIQEDIKIL